MIVIYILNESRGFFKDLASEILLRSTTSYTIYDLNMVQRIDMKDMPLYHQFSLVAFRPLLDRVYWPATITTVNVAFDNVSKDFPIPDTLKVTVKDGRDRH